MITTTLFLFMNTAHAWQIMYTEQGGELYRTDDVIEYYVDPNNAQNISDDGISTMIAGATRTWQKPLDNTLQFKDSAFSNGITDPYDNKNIIYFDDQWSHDPILLGLTFVWSKPTGEITGFDIAINSSNHNWVIESPDKNKDQNDLLNTLTHEFGHALGIDHSSFTNATMYSKSSTGETSKRDLALDDEKAVQYLYGKSKEEEKAGCKTFNDMLMTCGILMLIPVISNRRSVLFK